VSDDPFPVPVEYRPCFKVCFEDAKAILYLVAIIANPQDCLRIVIQVCSYRIVSIVLLFFVYDCLINRIVIGSFFAPFASGGTLDESRDIVWPFFNIIHVLGGKDFLGSLNLSVPYPVFDTSKKRKREEASLQQCFLLFFSFGKCCMEFLARNFLQFFVQFFWLVVFFVKTQVKQPV
jgi:hypothetical protein